MKVGYERDFLRYLQSLLAEVERRIRRGHARLALSQNQQSSGVSMKLIYSLCIVSLSFGNPEISLLLKLVFKFIDYFVFFSDIKLKRCFFLQSLLVNVLIIGFFLLSN